MEKYFWKEKNNDIKLNGLKNTKSLFENTPYKSATEHIFFYFTFFLTNIFGVYLSRPPAGKIYFKSIRTGKGTFI